MKNLYLQLSESFKTEWPDVKNVSDVNHEGRLFHKFLLQSSPRRELKLELSEIGLRASYYIQGTGVFNNYMSGTPDMFPAVLIEFLDGKYIYNTITGDIIKTDCLECLEPLVIEQMKQAIKMGINH